MALRLRCDDDSASLGLAQVLIVAMVLDRPLGLLRSEHGLILVLALATMAFHFGLQICKVLLIKEASR